MIIKIDADLQDLIPEFLNKRRNDIPVLWDAVKKNDFGTLENIGHKLKGNAGGYGFDQMGFFGAMIETGASEKNISKIEQALKELEKYINEIEIEYVQDQS